MNINADDGLVTVIIPFFQKEKGLLDKCVRSILEQKNYKNFHIIVIDDGSPVSAEEELKNISKDNTNLTILIQKNSGPGAARNKGLENLPENTEYVAFLDSDDQWENTFLSVAVSAMNEGCDMFFSNTYRAGFNETRFEWHSEDGLDLISSQHNSINSEKNIFKFKGDMFDYALVRSNIISTSSLVYRFSICPDMQFNVILFNGQDRLFKLSLCQQINNVSFSSSVLVKEGRGVNIFDSASWGTAKSLVLTSNYIKLSKTILKELKLNERQKTIVYQQLNDARYSFIASLLHLIKNRIKVDVKIIINILKADPGFLLQIIPIIFKILKDKK